MIAKNKPMLHDLSLTCWRVGSTTAWAKDLQHSLSTRCVMSVGTIGKKLGSDFLFGIERGGQAEWAEAAVWIRVADLMSARRRSGDGLYRSYCFVGQWNIYESKSTWSDIERNIEIITSHQFLNQCLLHYTPRGSCWFRYAHFVHNPQGGDLGRDTHSLFHCSDEQKG